MHPTSDFTTSYTINVLALSTILYYQFRRFTTLYYLIPQLNQQFYNSLLSYTINFDVLQLSTILYNQLRSFTTPYYPIHPRQRFSTL